MTLVYSLPPCSLPPVQILARPPPVSIRTKSCSFCSSYDLTDVYPGVRNVLPVRVPRTGYTRCRKTSDRAFTRLPLLHSLFTRRDPNRYSPRRSSTTKLIATYFCDVIANDNNLPGLQRYGFRTHRRLRHCADFRMLHAHNAVGRFYHYLAGNRSLWSTSKDVTNRSCNVEPSVPSSRDVDADGD